MSGHSFNVASDGVYEFEALEWLAKGDLLGPKCRQKHDGSSQFREPITIGNQDAADKLFNCTHILSDIQFNRWAANISLGGVQTLDGGISTSDCDRPPCSFLTTFAAPDLQVVGGNLTFHNLEYLTKIEFPKLNLLGGLELSRLLNLTTAVFNTTLRSPRISIINTALTSVPFKLQQPYVSDPESWHDSSLKLRRDNASLDTIAFEYPPQVDISLNDDLVDLDLSGLETATTLILWGNGQASNITLHNLVNAKQVYLYGVDHLDIRSLKTVTDSLEITEIGQDFLDLSSLESAGNLTIEDGTFKNLSMPRLKSVKDNFKVHYNRQLGRLDLPVLQQAGSAKGWFMVQENSDLLDINMPMIEELLAPTTLDGFETLTVTSLDKIATLALISKTFNCTAFEASQLPRIKVTVTNGFSCDDGSYHSAWPTSSSNYNHNYDYDKPKGLSQQSQVIMGACLTVAGLLIISLLMTYRRRRMQRARSAAAGTSTTIPPETQMVQEGDDEDEDRPPKYARVPRPGEGPPSYDTESSTEHSPAVTHTVTPVTGPTAV